MAVGGFELDGSSKFHGRITASVVITCIVAASSGLIFGFDIGISVGRPSRAIVAGADKILGGKGGVTTMRPFLLKFFPAILKKLAKAKTNMYCMCDSQILTLFTSSLYIAGFASSLVASRLTAAIGRRNIIVLGGITFLAGAGISGGSENIAVLILERILLGFGVGFTNQATPLYLSEVAPSEWRGAFNTGFQFFIAIGVVVSNCINFGTARLSWGWRLSQGLAGVLAAIMTIAALFITDSPSSLVERGKIEKARRSLQKVRGKDVDVEAELGDIMKSSEIAKASSDEPFLTIFERKYRPYLVMAIAIPYFQQLTGINIIAFYAPQLFKSVGFGSDSALIASIILGMVNLGSIIVSAVVVDRYGRRPLFLVGGVLMFVCQVGISFVLAYASGVSGNKEISRGYAILVVALMCTYAAAFGWSWGPLAWLIPSEIFPIKIRAIGQSIAVAMNFAVTFVLSQTFSAMLCHFKFGTFLFYAGWIGLMTVFIALFLPETKGIPLNSMYAVWEKHWFWRRFVKE